mmetsp:Transcript_1119/g.2211  ORF Transcript_1119/g.2211 Transcript_1119/m.2211 type:complete len:101 (+) Transcript_1119:859-1161(+)
MRAATPPPTTPTKVDVVRHAWVTLGRFAVTQGNNLLTERCFLRFSNRTLRESPPPTLLPPRKQHLRMATLRSRFAQQQPSQQHAWPSLPRLALTLAIRAR